MPTIISQLTFKEKVGLGTICPLPPGYSSANQKCLHLHSQPNHLLS